MAWKPVALLGLAVVIAVVASLPVGPRHAVPVAEAAGSCPITIRVHGTSSPSPPSIASLSEFAFDTAFAPGTSMAIGDVSGTVAVGYLTNNNADVAMATRPLSYTKLAGKYEWKLPTQSHAWIATSDADRTAPADNSRQVRADDWVNFVTNRPPPLLSAPPAVPDWDVNLDGNTSLGDLGAVAARWGQNSSCKGWIRADVANTGKVSLGSIGGVTRHWGQQGFVCNVLTFCCKQRVLCDWAGMIQDSVGGYEVQDSQCAELSNTGDPITLVVRGHGGVDVDTHLAHHGLTVNINTNFLEQQAAQFVPNTSYFRDDLLCYESEILRGQPEGYYGCGAPPWCLQNRLHVRAHAQTFGDPQYAGLTVASLTPHYDTAISPGVGTCHDTTKFGVTVVRNQHVILFNQDGRGISGFTAARNDVVTQWRAGNQHFVLATPSWNNTNQRQQCNGDVARADGFVVILGECADFPGQC